MHAIHVSVHVAPVCGALTLSHGDHGNRVYYSSSLKYLYYIIEKLRPPLFFERHIFVNFSCPYFHVSELVKDHPSVNTIFFINSFVHTPIVSECLANDHPSFNVILTMNISKAPISNHTYYIYYTQCRLKHGGTKTKEYIIQNILQSPKCFQKQGRQSYRMRIT